MNSHYYDEEAHRASLEGYANGDDHDYAWDVDRRDWVRKTTPNSVIK